MEIKSKSKVNNYYKTKHFENVFNMYITVPPKKLPCKSKTYHNI